MDILYFLLVILHLTVTFGMLQDPLDGRESEVVTLTRSKVNNVPAGTYAVKKLNISILSIFASSTINISAGSKFHITFSNSSEMMENQALWWRALFLKESYTNLVKKVSPFENIFFKINFLSPNKTNLNIQINFKLFDLRSFCWFIAGILLFIAARKLSRSVIFHYTSGASIGMMMSWMIILILLYRLLPYRRAMTTLLVTGTGAGFYFTELVFNKGYQLVLQYPYESLGICSFFALLSMALLYYFGPPSTERSYNLIQWTLQMGAIYMMYQSSYCKEFSITAIITLVFLQFISIYSVLIRIFILITPRKFRSWYNCPEERRLLTLEEYEEQGRVETEKALKELSEFCSSPDCNSWRVVSKLKDPKRFARFLNEKQQFTEEELADYDQFEIMEETGSFVDGSTEGSHDSAISLHGREEENWLSDDDTRGSSFSVNSP